MTRLFRILAGLNSTTVTATATIPPPPGDGIGTANVDTDFVVILASLLCALICVLGLFAVVRCAWIRRICGEGSDDFPSAAPSSAANKGLKKKVMKALPKLPYSAELSEKFSECPICLTEFDAGDEIRVLPPCGHGFHVTCIDTWLGSRSSCPSCRKILVPEPRCKKCGEFRFAGGTTPTGLSSGTFDRFLP